MFIYTDFVSIIFVIHKNCVSLQCHNETAIRYDIAKISINNVIHTIMSTKMKSTMKEVMLLAWQFVKKNGYTMSEALKCAWANIKLRALLGKKVVEFYFKKTDGTLRQAFGTLMNDRVPETKGTHKTAENCQVYFDTEKEAWRCFKKCNLVKIA